MRLLTSSFGFVATAYISWSGCSGPISRHIRCAESEANDPNKSSEENYSQRLEHENENGIT